MRTQFFATGIVALGLCSGLTAGTGCDWRAVDKDAQDTPVRSIGAPSGFGTADDFGRIVIPIAAPSETDGVVTRFLVSGATGTGLALVELNAAGGITSTNINAKVFSSGHGTTGFPLTSIAEIPGAKPGRALVAAKSIMDGSSIVYTVSLGGMHDGEVFTFTTPTSDPYLGTGVAVADLTGEATPDYLIAGPDSLKVYVDGKPTGPLLWPTATSGTACPLSLPYNDDPDKLPLNRPILVGHFVDGGPDKQVAMSTFGLTGKGSVSFFGVDASAGITCLGTISNDEPQFGYAMAMGDFNKDLVTDLVIGTPPSKAFIFPGPLSPTATGIALPVDANEAIAYGKSVGVVNLDGAGPDLAAVGDPGAASGSALLAGNVSLFKLTGATPSLVRTLEPHDPAANASYGATITGIPFCGMQCSPGITPRIPLIGAQSRILAYFTLGASDLRKPKP